MKNKAISFAGWYGVLAILVAYALVTFNIVVAKSYVYQSLNLTGAVGLVVVATSKKDAQPATLNVIWAIIALVAMVQLLVH